MFAQGYRRVTSIDFSDIVIAEMREKTQGVVRAEAAAAESGGAAPVIADAATKNLLQGKARRFAESRGDV